MTTKDVKCPVCETQMAKTDVPKHSIYSCKSCGELVQVLPDGTLFPMTTMLERSAHRDDRVRAAISTPHVTTVKSFIDSLDGSIRSWKMELGGNVIELRSLLAQIENRLDHALASLSGLDLALPQIGDTLASLREARELVSTMPASNRGIPEESDDVISSVQGEYTPAGAGG